MAQRFAGPFNGILPEPTGMAIGFLKDPKKLPHTLYAQFVPAPEVLFRYFKMHPDQGTEVPDVDQNVWAYGDYRPVDAGAGIRGEWIAGRIQRYDFPYTLDDQTDRAWGKAGFNLKSFLDQIKLNEAGVHRSVRILAALSGATYAANNTATVAALTGVTGAYWDLSSGTEIDPTTGTTNPMFQLIKKTLDRVMRRIDLATNGAVGEREYQFILPPKVAIAVAENGEIVNAVKQSVYANTLVNPETGWRNRKWNLPDEYAGFQWIVEDTVRTTSRKNADGTAVTIGSGKDYVLTDDTCYCTSRPGGIDGGYGTRSFATVQLYTLGGEARVEAFSEPKHQLTEGHIVLEDAPIVPTTLSGFKLTSVLSSGFTV